MSLFGEGLLFFPAFGFLHLREERQRPSLLGWLHRYRVLYSYSFFFPLPRSLPLSLPFSLLFLAQIGVLIIYAITPVVVHSDLTAAVCNSSAPPDSALHAQWSDEIYTQFSYLLLVQAGIAVLLILPALFGKAVFY